MKVEYFPTKNWYISKRKNGVIRGLCSAVSLKSFQLSVKRLDGFILCIQGQRKTSSSQFQAAWKRLRIENIGRTFMYKYFLDFEEKYGKMSDCRTSNYFKFSHFIAGTSATLTVCVTVLICCFGWTTTSTTLSNARSSPREETSTDSQSYLTKTVNFN